MKENENAVDGDKAITVEAAEIDCSTISINSEYGACLRIERDGTVHMVVDGELQKCSNFKDLAKAFMFCIYRISPETDWRGIAPEVFEEIKHLINVEEK